MEYILPDSRYTLYCVGTCVYACICACMYVCVCVFMSMGMHMVGIKHGIAVSKGFEYKLEESLIGISISVFHAFRLSTDA